MPSTLRTIILSSEASNYLQGHTLAVGGGAGPLNFGNSRPLTFAGESGSWKTD